MRRRARCVLLALSLASACSEEQAARGARSHAVVASPRHVVSLDLASSLGAAVLARDDAGRPSLLRALSVPLTSAVTPSSAARAYLERFAPVWDASPAELVETRVVTLPSGFVVVGFRSEVGGVPIDVPELRVAMRDLALVSITGALPSAPLAHDHAFRLREDEARARAAASVEGAAETIAKRVLTVHEDALVPAYRVFVRATRGTMSEGFRVRVDARDGRVLETVSLTASDAFTYRVYADADAPHTPLEGPQESTFPHPAGMPTGVQPGFVGSRRITVEGLDPWLADGATATRGNNVDAYADLNEPDGFTEGSDFRAALTGERELDYTYDTSLDALAGELQQRAAITQLFYTANFLHDLYYGYGFTEAAGNAQADVYGRGGTGGDALLAEAQDAALAGARDNANMMTPDDGIPPRMQIYVWNGVDTRTFTVSSAASPLATSTASFGAFEFDVAAEVALAVDGTGVSPTDACEAITSDVAGKVVVVDRGLCLFVEKAANVQAAGGLAMIVVNNVPGNGLTGMSGSAPDVTIPCVGIGNDDGTALRTSVSLQTVTARLLRDAQPKRDASLDGTIVAHEWGHYLHHRLTDCETTSQCRAMSEGWADFVALHMGLREGDDLTGVYPIAVYADSAGSTDPAYFGLRRAPYSIDRTKNDFSFRHIARGATLPSHALAPRSPDASEVHNAGEIWTAALFDVLVALAQTHGLAEARARMGRYVVLGLLVTPPLATYTEARDGLLTAIAAADAEDFSLAAARFAGRGMGTCAVSPNRYSADLVDVVESTTVGARFEVRSIALVDDVTSCDHDGVLDRGELGHVEITVANLGTEAAAPTVAAESLSPVLVLDTPSMQAETIAPFTTATVRLPAELAPGVTSSSVAEVLAHAESGCGRETSLSARIPVNLDDVAARSTTETFESAHAAFTASGSPSFRRTEDPLTLDASYTTRYLGRADAYLVSPAFMIGAGVFRIHFEHRYLFETDATGGGLDGGVIEISFDDGVTWEDAVSRAQGTYPGAILDADNAAPALRGRPAYVGRSPVYPAMPQVTLDFGEALAGRTARIRFRFATNDALRNVGWEIDDVTLEGIVGTPFGVLVPDRRVCEADAGEPPMDAEVPVEDAATVPDARGGVAGGAGCSASGDASGALWMALVLCLAAQRARKRMP